MAVLTYTANIARFKAQCILDKKLHVCNGKCSACEKYSRLQRVYNSLDDFQRLCVDDDVRSYVISLEPLTKAEIRQRRKPMYKRLLLVVILAAVIVFACRGKLHAQDRYTELHAEILATLERTHSQVRDVNKDGLVNCIDYAVTFKRQWDKYYDPARCGIEHNQNYTTGWNHLFVRCFPKDSIFWVSVEPQATGAVYDMYTYWGDKYWGVYDYDDTEYWLSRCK